MTPKRFARLAAISQEAAQGAVTIISPEISRASPPSIREHLAVVPPISRARMFSSPISLPSSAAPQKPEAGPPSTMLIGTADVASRLSTPQLDCMI